MNIKHQVQDFYNQVGWQQVGDGYYQNAIYEDLRLVSSEYIHRCHLRVARHLKSTGMFFLDAGSGPIQYSEYLEYSKDYRYRVCADISWVALQEARRRIGEHGLFVVADIANLPFKPAAFEGVVSLHTIHHLPLSEHLQAYQELYRVLAQGCTAVVVNGWSVSPITEGLKRWQVRVPRLRRLLQSFTRQKQAAINGQVESATESDGESSGDQVNSPRSTFVEKNTASWFKREIGSQIPLKIYVWRTVSVSFLRAAIHERWGGRWLLRLLFWLEERFPHVLGEKGQYPLVVLVK